MKLLQRLTTQYVDFEDRIRLSGEDAEGNVQVLWLTQRLLGRLVPALCKPLESAGGAAAGLVNSFEQQAAQAQLAAQDPVPAVAASAAWLVTRVDLATTPQGLRLVFFAQEGEVAAIAMPELSLRQWQAILREQCRGAGWPGDAWPAWLEPEAVPPGAALAFH